MARWLEAADRFWAQAVDLAWGLPLVILLICSGIYFTFFCRFVPFRRIPHAIRVLRGTYDNPNDPGEITHFQALSSALAATIGMGNIAGVAIAVTVGGPGAVFWMWIAGLVGMATKFFECTLSCMYRKEDSRGIVQGGPMYWIEIALGPQWRFLGVLFSLFGMLGCLALFQVNQLASLLHADYAIPRAITGAAATSFVAVVVLGGIVRVGRVTARVVPFMAILYVVAALVILAQHLTAIPAVLESIFTGAFQGTAAVGGVAGVTVREALITGVRRAAFSNEAGMGTAPMAHGAARTSEPVREGLVAMLGPFIDTNIVCSLTAFVILATGVTGTDDGVLLTASAFEQGIPYVGRFVLTVVILLFSTSTMISYSYYGTKCAKYLLGETRGARYVYVYLLTMFLGALWSQDMVINMLDTAFALMAVPTLTSTLALSPRVLHASRGYFRRMAAQPSRTEH